MSSFRSFHREGSTFAPTEAQSYSIQKSETFGYVLQLHSNGRGQNYNLESVDDVIKNITEQNPPNGMETIAMLSRARKELVSKLDTCVKIDEISGPK